MHVKNKYMAINQILRKNQVLSALKSCHFKSALFLLSGLMFSGVARSGLVMFWAEKEWMCQKSVLTRRTKVSPWQLAQHSGFSSWQKQKGLLGFLQGSHTFPPLPYSPDQPMVRNYTPLYITKGTFPGLEHYSPSGWSLGHIPICQEFDARWEILSKAV